jgi:type II secretory pathway component PulF
MYSFEMTFCDCCAEVTLVMKVAGLLTMVILHFYFRTTHGTMLSKLYISCPGFSDSIQLYNVYLFCSAYFAGVKGDAWGQSPQS